MTRRNFVSLAAGLAATRALRAETAQERAKKIVGDTIQALGGDGFRFMQTRTESGRAYSFYREQITGLSVARIYTKYLPKTEGAGVHLVQRQTFGKKLDDAVILTDKAAWEVTYRGARPLGDQRVKQFRDSTLHEVFYILRMRLDEPGVGFEARGREVVENLPVESVEFFDAENNKVVFWVHSSTSLPVKQSFRRWDPTINDWRDEVTRFTRYREAGNGVMWPWDTQRERDTEKLFELYSEKVVIGETLADSMFELPPGVTVLKK